MDRGGAVRSIQAANVDMPEDELLALWQPVNLERLARTYWKYLSRVTLGIIRVTYTDEERAVVVIGRPLVLLRFHAPDYDIKPRPRDRALEHPGRPAGLAPQRGLPGDRRAPDGVRARRLRAHPRRGRGRRTSIPAIVDLDRALVLRQHPVAHPRARHARVPALAGQARARGVRRRALRRRGRQGVARSTSATRPGRAWPCSASDRSRARVIPAVSTSASCEEGLAPMELMKPWKSPRKRCAITFTPAAAQRLRVGLALVAQRVEARGDHQARRGLAQPRRAAAASAADRRDPTPPAGSGRCTTPSARR